MDELAPVEYMIVSFPGNRFRGDIAPALGRLVDAGLVRIIDLAFVTKDAGGAVAALELSELDDDVRSGLANLGADGSGLLNEDDLADAAAALEPNSSAALLVWENLWAAELAGALRNAGGVVLAIDRIPHDVAMAARAWAIANA